MAALPFRLARLAGSLAIGAGALACSPSGSGADAAATCPNDLPAPPAALCGSTPPPACPTPVPGYKDQVAPIFQNHCVLCHSPTGSAGKDMTTYAGVSSQASSILDQTNICAMPPTGYPELTLTERATLLTWLVCCAPDN